MVQLHLGSRGSDVLALQQKLKTAGFYSGSLDSSFGPQTLAALKAFQTKAKLKVDGWYGDQSAAALASWPTSTTPTTGTMPNTTIPDPAQLGYNPSGMTGDKATKASDAYKTEMAKEDRAIAEAMNRRGIYGSTIMGENINNAADALKKKMDAAWSSAYARGYASNDEAALLGLTPGKALRTLGTGGGGGGSGSPSGHFDADTEMKNLGTTNKAFVAAAIKEWDTNPYKVIDSIMRNNNLTDNQKTAILMQLQPTYYGMDPSTYNNPNTMGVVPGRGPEYWLQEWLKVNRWYKNASGAYPSSGNREAPPTYNGRWEGWY